MGDGGGAIGREVDVIDHLRCDIESTFVPQVVGGGKSDFLGGDGRGGNSTCVNGVEDRESNGIITALAVGALQQV